MTKRYEVEHAPGYSFTKRSWTGYEYRDYIKTLSDTSDIYDEVDACIDFVVDEVYHGDASTMDVMNEDWDLVVIPVYIEAAKLLVPKVPGSGKTTETGSGVEASA